MSQNGRPLEIGDKINLHCLVVNRNDAILYRSKNKELC